MNAITLEAPGKLNLTLDVLGKRPDGYHEMRMVMQTVSLSDTVTVTLSDVWRCECDDPAIPQGEENLCMRAARAFYAQLGREVPTAISVVKRIPVGGGMAGGSADAAAVLRALNTLFDEPFTREKLSEIGAEVGSDVPYCVIGGTMLAEGRGEKLTALDRLPDCSFVLAKPEFSVSTPEAFRALDEAGDYPHPDTEAALRALKAGDISALCHAMCNSFEPLLERRFPVIRDLRARLYSRGANTARLTGTGSVVFGLFQNPLNALRAARALYRDGFETFSAHPVYY